MDNDHGITDELRVWIDTIAWLDDSPLRKNITAIADRIDAMLAERYVELPKDADGETWHIGDFTESGQLVYKLFLDVHGWSFYGLVNDIDPSIHRHYHEPTVEDVLRKLIGRAQALGCIEDEDELVAEFAKRLRLRGDE